MTKSSPWQNPPTPPFTHDAQRRLMFEMSCALYEARNGPLTAEQRAEAAGWCGSIPDHLLGDPIGTGASMARANERLATPEGLAELAAKLKQQAAKAKRKWRAEKRKKEKPSRS